jgi:uncharacterized protein YceK
MKWGAFMLVLALSVGLVGCASVRTTIVYREGANAHNTATARLQVPPDRVYAAALRVLGKKTTAVILSRDDRNHSIDALKTLQHIRIAITPEDSSGSLVEIVSDAGTSMMEYTDQALGMMEEICNELDILYTVPPRNR